MRCGQQAARGYRALGRSSDPQGGGNGRLCAFPGRWGAGWGALGRGTDRLRGVPSALPSWPAHCALLESFEAPTPSQIMSLSVRGPPRDVDSLPL